jgi:homoserine O-acetyltransferase
VIEAIQHDPTWNDGNYETQPQALRVAAALIFFMGSNPILRQEATPTLAKADEELAAVMDRAMREQDANDVIYQVGASWDYDPNPDLEKIRAPLYAVNSADDLINPPELGILEKEITRVKHGKAVVIPLSKDTRGHGSHTVADLWKQYLAELLDASK